MLALYAVPELSITNKDDPFQPYRVEVHGIFVISGVCSLLGVSYFRIAHVSIHDSLQYTV